MRNVTNKKTSRQNGTPNIRYNINKHRPEIRDDLDSREGEEQHFKGDDITHNRKSHRSKKHSANN
jgi:hypothetical protein